MKPCTIPDINEKVVKVYKDWYMLFYIFVTIIYFVFALMEFVKCGHIGFSVMSGILMLGFFKLMEIPDIRQRKAIMQIETFYVVKIK